MKLGPTNNDPYVVAIYYLEAVQEYEGYCHYYYTCLYLYLIGCPTILRNDYGTENTVLASYQMALRHQHSDHFSGEKVTDLVDQ